MDRATFPVRALALFAAAGGLCLAVAGPARASGSFFPGVAADGPSADVRTLDDVDLARGGTGILAWTRVDGGENHLFWTDLTAGQPGSPNRGDGGLPALNSPASASVADGGRAVIVFTNSSGAWAIVRPKAGQPFGSPQQIGGPGSAWPSVDMTSGTGVAYAAWSENGDVRAAWMGRGATAFTVLAGTADINAARNAGSTADTRPRVGTAADGIGVVAFGESDGATTRSGARRLVRSRLSDYVTDMGVESEAGQSADRADVAFEDDSSFGWLAFRQRYSDGTTRAVLRRLRGTRTDSPVLLAGGGELAAWAYPRVAVAWREAGLAVAQAADGTVWGTIIRDDRPVNGVPLGSSPGLDAMAVPTIASNEYGIAAWATPGGPGAFARNFEDDKAASTPPPFLPGGSIAGPQGPVVAGAGMEASSNRVGDAVIAFVQESGGSRSISVASYDLAPKPVDLDTSSRWLPARPKLTWEDASEVWPGLTYRILLDGKEIGTSTRPFFTPATAISTGRHTWQVVAVDRRGQSASSAVEPIRVDGTPPKLSVSVSGRGTLRIDARATKARPPRGSGLASIRVDFGDRTAPAVTNTSRLSVRHRFGSRTVTMRIVATDRAGNTSVATYRVSGGRATPVRTKVPSPGATPAR
ncbi:MAG: hypothetical protein ACKOB9_03735 [Solirubrobacterales bacterium]